MELRGKTVGFALTGAYCVFAQVFPEVEKVVSEGAEVIPLVSYQVAETDSRYGKASEFLIRLELMTGHKVLCTIAEAEGVNKSAKPLDILIIAPCTAATLAKLATGDAATPVLMMAKEQFRNNLPVVLGIATNDGLGISAKNIGSLLAAKNVFFIPFGQDDPLAKPNSLVAKFELTVPAVKAALEGRQFQPVLQK